LPSSWPSSVPDGLSTQRKAWLRTVQKGSRRVPPGGALDQLTEIGGLSSA
jgi:hypothetical protein